MPFCLFDSRADESLLFVILKPSTSHKSVSSKFAFNFYIFLKGFPFCFYFYCDLKEFYSFLLVKTPHTPSPPNFLLYSYSNKLFFSQHLFSFSQFFLKEEWARLGGKSFGGFIRGLWKEKVDKYEMVFREIFKGSQ